MGWVNKIYASVRELPDNLIKRISKKPISDGGSNKYDTDYFSPLKIDYYHINELLEDPQVKLGIRAMVLFLASRKLIFSSASEDEGDVMAKEFIEEMFEDMKGTLRHIRKDLYSAIIYGFSAVEVIYGLNNDDKVVITDFHSIHRKTLNHPEAFKYDKNGNITHLQQDIGERKYTKIPINKVILYSFDKQFGDPVGQSIISELNDVIKTKKKIFKYLKIYLQKHESPFMVMKVAQEQNKDIARKQLDEVLEGRTQMTIDKDDEINMIESHHRGESFFKIIQYYDDLIFRTLFIGTLLFGQQERSGSYAQSQTQFEVAKLLLDGIHRELVPDIQKIIDYLIKINFTDVKSPKIEFEKFEDKDILELLRVLQPYVDNFTINPKSEWFQELISTIIEELSGVKTDLGGEGGIPFEHRDLVEDYGEEERELRRLEKEISEAFPQ